MKKKFYAFLLVFTSVFLFPIGMVEGYTNSNSSSFNSSINGYLLSGQSVTFEISMELSGPEPSSTSEVYSVSYSFSYTGHDISLTECSASVTGAASQSDDDGGGSGSYDKSMDMYGSTSIKVTWTCSGFFTALDGGIGYFSNEKVSLSCTLEVRPGGIVEPGFEPFLFIGLFAFLGIVLIFTYHRKFKPKKS